MKIVKFENYFGREMLLNVIGKYRGGAHIPI